jgi:excisionase family DNA binding protein
MTKPTKQRHERKCEQWPAALSPELSAEYLGFSERMLYQKRQEGKFPAPVDLGGNLRRWRRTDLDAWLAGLPTITETPEEPPQLAAGRRAKKSVDGGFAYGQQVDCERPTLPKSRRTRNSVDEPSIEPSATPSEAAA